MEAGAPMMEGGYGGEFGGRGGEFGGYGMEGGMGQPGADQDRTVLLANRYLNPEGQPIPVTSPTPTPGEFGKEYKLLPIRMHLEMDLRWLSHLIANCANQPLQVEVQEVRINPANAGTTGGFGGFGGEFGGRGGGYSSGGAGASPFASAPGRNGEILTFNSRPHVASVVIQGNICIFNPPNPESLGAPQGPETVALVP
jgi:hypothetical protein